MKTPDEKLTGISNYFENKIIDPVKIANPDPYTINHKINYNSTHYEICYDCKCHGSDKNKNMSLFDLNDVEYKINSYGYRSDEFSKEDAKNNFLYAGCSVTFGVGLPFELTWPSFLNKKNDGEKIFNLGINGISSNIITYNINKYIEQFGKPKAVFALYPNFSRMESFIDDNLSIIHFREDSEKTLGNANQYKLDVTSTAVNVVNSIILLENYLNAIEVPFFWSTWSGHFSKVAETKYIFKNYVKFGSDIDEDLLLKYNKHHYFNKARDNDHMGILAHLSVSQSFFNAWKGYNEKRNP